MPDESAETPKRDANENPWYQLATLYGEPGPGDHELQARNRMAWNRYMAGRLTDEARATLIDEKRHSAEELTPFSPDELEALAQDFAKRSGSPDRVPCPVVEGKIDFSSVQFGHFSASGFFFAASVYFSKASFSGGADFGYVTFSEWADFGGATFSGSVSFVNAEMKGETSFKGARFKTEPPLFFGAKLHEGTMWRGGTWPRTPRDAMHAGLFVDAYERLKLEMDRLKKHEDELDFFARELQSRRVLHGDWKLVTTIPLYRPAFGLWIAAYGLASDFGRSYVRPLWGLLLTAAVGALVFWPHLGWFEIEKALGLSFANTFGVFGFRKDFISPELVEALPSLLKLVAAAQTVLGAVLLFLLGLALRNRFRMK